MKTYEKRIKNSTGVKSVRYLGGDVSEIKFNLADGRILSCRVIGLEFGELPCGAELADDDLKIKVVEEAITIGLCIVRDMELNRTVDTILGGLDKEFTVTEEVIKATDANRIQHDLHVLYVF